MLQSGTDRNGPGRVVRRWWQWWQDSSSLLVQSFPRQLLEGCEASRGGVEGCWVVGSGRAEEAELVREKMWRG